MYRILNNLPSYTHGFQKSNQQKSYHAQVVDLWANLEIV